MAIRTTAEPPSVTGERARLVQAVRRAYRWPTWLAGFNATVLVHEAAGLHLGQLLPTAVVSTETDPGTGALRAVETSETSWIPVDGVWLPAHRRVVRQDAAGCVAHELELVEHAVGVHARG